MGTVSRSSAGRSDSPQSGLSAAASAASTSQTSVSAVEEVANGLDRPVDLVVAVRERDEHALELGRCHVDASVEQVPEQRRVPCRVRADGVVVVAHGAVLAEQGQHRADALDGAEGSKACLEPGAAKLELLVDRGIAEPAQHRGAGGGREWVSRERSRLVDVTDGSQLLHQLGTAAESCRGETAADD